MSDGRVGNVPVHGAQAIDHQEEAMRGRVREKATTQIVDVTSSDVAVMDRRVVVMVGGILGVAVQSAFYSRLARALGFSSAEYEKPPDNPSASPPGSA